MTIDKLESMLKGAGYEYKRATNTRIIIYTEENRKDVLRALAEITEGTYTQARTGSGWKSSVGAVLVGGLVIVAKSLTKGLRGNIASLDARSFTALGENTTFNYGGREVAVVKFTSADKIRDSILQGLESSPLLGEAYKEMVEPFFDTGKIEWAPDVPQAVVSKLGVYIGEVLIGWVALARKQPKYFRRNPFLGTPKAFYLPTDPSFSGVDSFIEVADGSYYGISSKFGRGAKASLFTNLLKVGIEKESSLRPSVFKDICKVARNNLKYTNSKSIVYAYGIRNILKLNSSIIPNPDVVYQQAYANKPGKELTATTAAIIKIGTSQDIKSKLPASVSAFFTRTMADMLNKDKESLNQIEEILTGKEYWQANLNIADWRKGTVSFSFVKASKAVVKIFGNKSAIGDISAKQGWINYELS